MSDEIEQLRNVVQTQNGIISRLKHELAALKSQGTVAWADVPDATEWLEDLRGNALTPKPGEPT